MSIIDCIGFALILCLCYIGYQRGITRKSIFIVTFFSSVLVFYLSFDVINKILFLITNSIAIAGLFTFFLIMLPCFLSSYLLLNKLFKTSYFKNKSLFAERILPSSRILGVVFGFVSGYIFLTSLMIFSVKNIKSKCPECVLPPLLENSIFYKFTNTSYNHADDSYVKVDNLPVLKFLISKDNIAKFQFSQNDIEILLSVIKGISNQAASFLIAKKNEGAEDRDIIILLIQSYEKERMSVDATFIVDPEKTFEIQKRLLLSHEKPSQSQVTSKKITINQITAEYE